MFLSTGVRYMTPRERAPAPGHPGWTLPHGLCPPCGLFRTAARAAVARGPTSVSRSVLRVQLDDQLLLDRRVDDLPGGERVNEDAQLSRDRLEPRGNGALAGLGPGD